MPLFPPRPQPGSTVEKRGADAGSVLRGASPANRGLRLLGAFVSTGRLGRPLMHFRFPGLDRIDQFYYTSANVDKRTTSRFYGYTLEDPGGSALSGASDNASSEINPSSPLWRSIITPWSSCRLMKNQSLRA